MATEKSAVTKQVPVNLPEGSVARERVILERFLFIHVFICSKKLNDKNTMFFKININVISEPKTKFYQIANNVCFVNIHYQ